MTQAHNFIQYLETLADDKGALAALRRGLGQPPGTVTDLFRYIIPRLPENVYPGSWSEKTYYLIASLFALHPVNTPTGNMGTHFATLRDPDPEKNDALERRFTSLLNANPEDFHIFLRQAISFLKSKDETPINWHALMWDTLALGNPDRAPLIQKQWAQGFWQYHPSKKDDLSTED